MRAKGQLGAKGVNGGKRAEWGRKVDIRTQGVRRCKGSIRGDLFTSSAIHQLVPPSTTNTPEIEYTLWYIYNHISNFYSHKAD